MAKMLTENLEYLRKNHSALERKALVSDLFGHIEALEGEHRELLKLVADAIKPAAGEITTTGCPGTKGYMRRCNECGVAQPIHGHGPLVHQTECAYNKRIRAIAALEEILNNGDF